MAKRDIKTFIRKRGYEALPKRMGNQRRLTMIVSWFCCIGCLDIGPQRKHREGINSKSKGKRQADLRRGACRIKKEANPTPEPDPGDGNPLQERRRSPDAAQFPRFTHNRRSAPTPYGTP